MPWGAQIRFEFQWCEPEAGAGSPWAARAALTMGLRNGTVGTSTGINLHGWMDATCGKEAKAATQVTLSAKTTEKKVGLGKCQGAKPKPIKTSTGTEVACKTECTIRNTNPAFSGEQCDAFAYKYGGTIDDPKPEESECIIYESDIDTSVKQPEDPNSKWVCWNMKEDNAKSDVSQTIAAAEEADLQKALAVLRLREALAGPQDDMAQAKVYEFQPRADNACCGGKECFSGMWWFEPEDKAGVMTALELDPLSWPGIASYLPEPKKLQDPLDKGKIYIDRVLVKTCKTELAGWGRDCVMPEVKASCEKRQTINAVITGILVPVLGWLIVKLACSKQLPNAKRDGDFEGKGPICLWSGKWMKSCPKDLLFSCLVAVVATAAIAFLSSFAVSTLIGSTECLHGEREWKVVAFAAWYAGAAAIILGLLYIDYVANHQGTPEPTHKLMLVQVDENEFNSRKPGQTIKATPLNQDILASGNGSGRAGTQMSQIDVDTSGQDLGAMQSRGSFGSGVMSTNRSMQ